MRRATLRMKPAQIAKVSSVALVWLDGVWLSCRGGCLALLSFVLSVCGGARQLLVDCVQREEVRTQQHCSACGGSRTQYWIWLSLAKRAPNFLAKINAVGQRGAACRRAAD